MKSNQTKTTRKHWHYRRGENIIYRMTQTSTEVRSDGKITENETRVVIVGLGVFIQTKKALYCILILIRIKSGF